MAFLGKAFDTAAGDVFCLDCSKVEEGGEGGGEGPTRPRSRTLKP